MVMNKLGNWTENGARDLPKYFNVFLLFKPKYKESFD